MNPAQRREWRRRLFGCPELTPAQRLVLLALEGFADWPEGTNARPGVVRLAELCRLEERAVKRALGRGRELGLIEQTARANPRRGWAATHRLVSQPDSQTDSTCTVSHLETGFKVTRETVQGDSFGRSRCTAVPPTYPDQYKGTEEPPRYCPEHPNDTDDNCRPCGRQRKKHERWQTEQAERNRQAAEARAQARAECHLCDGYGWAIGPDGTPLEPARRCPGCNPVEAVTA